MKQEETFYKTGKKNLETGKKNLESGKKYLGAQTFKLSNFQTLKLSNSQTFLPPAGISAAGRLSNS
jgi:hypothetical protein